jgi:hypothetical protein
MPKRRIKKVKFTPAETAYELPDELDFAKLRYVGRGIEALERHIGRKKNPRMTREQMRRGVMGKYARASRNDRRPITAVALEEDVAAVFKDSKSVNDVLRAIIKSLPHDNVRKRRRSA